MKPAGPRTILPSGPRRPLLHSVLRGGISWYLGLLPQQGPNPPPDASPRPFAPEIRAWVADAPPGWGERSASGELVDLPGVVRLLRFPHRQHDRRDIPGHRQLGQVWLGPVLELSVVALAERI